MRIACLLALTLAGFYTLAQEDSVELATVPARNDNHVRGAYIQSFPDHFFIYPVIKQRSLSFGMEKQDGSELLTFKPNNSYSFGLGAYIFEVGVELAFAIPLDEKSISTYGKSDARDLQLNVLGKQWGADAYYQKYAGFYLIDRENPNAPKTPFPQRSDIETRNIGIVGNYVFNHNKFSFRSVYNFAERQLFSKGSFLVFATISSFRMQADSSILTPSQEIAFGPTVSFEKLRYSTFSLAPGYTYSLIFKNFFLNGTLALGPAHHWISHELEGGTTRNDVAINTFVAARIGIGYNAERFFGGITFISQGSVVKFDDVEFSSNNGSFKILMGYRFRESGILKKRAWDAVPLKI